LVLRAAAGTTLAVQGIIDVFSRSSLTVNVLAASIFLTLTGVFILIGFLTPIVSLLAALECAAALVWTTLPWGLLSSNFVVFRLIAMFAAIALIGPGAFSVDAHIFGWKEIVIPSATQRRGEE
jgi:putative oxidoreductase